MGNTKNKECMAYKNKLAYTLQYNKEHTSKRIVNFNNTNETDLEILEFIESKRPFSSYVKSLILKDMNENK
jgi:hypothetical protein